MTQETTEYDPDAAKVVLFVLALIVIIGIMVLLATALAPARPDPAVREWEHKMKQREADTAWEAEQDRLHRKHGLDRLIIYEPNREPYYIDEKGRRCRFI